MPTSSVQTEPAAARALTWAAYISFVPIGIATVLLAPMLPVLSSRWSLNYAQAGALWTAQYLASTCAVAYSGVLASKKGYRFPMKAGLLLMSVGLFLLLSGSKILGIVCIAAYGAGLGLAVPPANLLVANVSPEGRSARLNLLNFFWSMGAVSCPFLVSAALRSQSIPLFLMCVAAFSLLVALGIALMPARIVEPAASRETGKLLPLIRSNLGAFLVLGILFLIYVGTENAFGGWVASYSKSLGGLAPAVAVMTPSFFYASLMIGRWIAPAMLRITGEIRLVQAGLLLACAGTTTLMFSRELPGVALSACAAGLGLSSVYPITIALLSTEFQSARMGSVMFTLSNIGGGLLPWIVGVFSNRFGTIKAGLIVPLAGSLVMFALYLRKWSRTAS